MQIKWKGPDGFGYLYQNPVIENAGQYNIAIPSRGLDPHPGPDFRLIYDGETIGSYPTMGDAQNAAEKHLMTLLA
jgi:hypothetical protein